MQLLIAIVLALALSVPVGTALVAFGALVLEFGLGLLVEAGEKLEADPHKKKIAGVVALVGIGVFVCVMCVAVMLWAAALLKHVG